MKKGIKPKIYKAFFMTVIISLAVSIFASQIDLMIVTNITQDSNQEIGERTADNSETALIQQAVENNQRFAIAQAENINQMLEEFAAQLESVAGYIHYMDGHRDQYGPVPYHHPSENTGEGMQMQWLLPEGMALTDELQQEIYFWGNLEGLYQSIVESNSNIQAIYFTLANGVNTGYDNVSANKPQYFEGRQSYWYQGAVEAGGLFISDTYMDSFGRGMTITMSMPCYDQQGNLIGVIALDILIENLNREIRTDTFGNNETVMLFSKEQTLIAAPGLRLEQSEDLQPYLGDNYEEIARAFQRRTTGSLETSIEGKPYYIIYSPVNLSSWTYAVALPVENIIEPAKETSAQILEIAQGMEREMEQKLFIAQIGKLALILVAIGVIILYTKRVSDNITKPILKLRDDVKKITEGDLTYHSDIRTEDEIEELSKAFEGMTEELKAYIVNLSRVTAEKERISAELNVATQIQTSMLPCIFPAYPDRSEFDIYAFMEAAKEVGGDFYDFFMLDQDQLGVVIADVSGKGVPAALFMVIAKTLIKNHLQLKKTPHEVFEIVNNQLCENNEAGMFVTAFMGILNVRTGQFTYVNAGHNPPCLINEKGQVQFLNSIPGFVLAGIENMPYQQGELILKKGEKLFFYTDGVTEAMNQKQELYGNERLLLALEKAKEKSPQELLEYLKQQLIVFADGAEQADDITMMAVEYKGGADR